MHQCQADSTTTNPQIDGIATSKIGMKKSFLFIAGNTDSGIFYIKVNIFFPESVAEKNVALSGEFQRIVQEIRNHLIEAYTVDFDCILFSLFWYEFNFDTGFGF